MGTAFTALVTAGKLVTFGFCLGVGFWASRRLTNVADEYLLKWDEKKQQKIARDIDQELAGCTGATT